MRWNSNSTRECPPGGEAAKVVTGASVIVRGETMFASSSPNSIWTTSASSACRAAGGVVHYANYVLPSRHPLSAPGYVIAESTEYPAMSWQQHDSRPPSSSRNRHTADDAPHHRTGAGGTRRPYPASAVMPGTQGHRGRFTTTRFAYAPLDAKVEWPDWARSRWM